jgi:hypothetical protein
MVEKHVAHSNALQATLRDGTPYLCGPQARFFHHRDKLHPIARALADELAAMGGEIQWSVTAPLQGHPRQYSFQYVVTGASGQRGTVTCTFPKAGGAQKCQAPGSAGGGPVVVTIP